MSDPAGPPPHKRSKLSGSCFRKLRKKKKEETRKSADVMTRYFSFITPVQSEQSTQISESVNTVDSACDAASGNEDLSNAVSSDLRFQAKDNMIFQENTGTEPLISSANYGLATSEISASDSASQMDLIASASSSAKSPELQKDDLHASSSLPALSTISEVGSTHEDELENEEQCKVTSDDFGTYVGHIVRDTFIKIYSHERFCGEQYISTAGGSRENREFKSHWLYRNLPSGDRVRREWLVYSHVKQACFCVPCHLYSHISLQTSQFATTEGFSTWKKLNPRVEEHEMSSRHRECYLLFLEGRRRIGTEEDVSSLLKTEFLRQEEKMRAILLRIVKVIKFLAKQNLAFRGHRGESITEFTSDSSSETNRGNFLEAMLLLADFDPVVATHMSEIQKGGVSHLSKVTQNELIDIMGGLVRRDILNEIRGAGVFGIMCDTTPDRNHVEQMSIVIRYVHVGYGSNAEVLERETFIDCVALDGPTKNAETIANAIIDKLVNDGLDLKQCVAQSYDNAAVMAGEHSGVQMRLQRDAPSAMFVNCSNHSLNLSCVSASQIEPTVVTFFATLDRLYNFFSSSTIRWELLLKTNVRVKRTCPTRWSARHDAVEAVCRNFAEIVDALETLTEEPYNKETRAEAIQLQKAITTFQFVAFLKFWRNTLQPIERSQKVLQDPNVDVAKAANTLSNLAEHCENEREEMTDEALKEAVELCEQQEIPILMEKRRRKKKRMPGELAEDAPLTPENELRRIFKAILDKLALEIRGRGRRLFKLNETFRFLHQLWESQAGDVLRKNCKDFSSKYDSLISACDLYQEIKDIQKLTRHEDKGKLDSIASVLRYVCEFGEHAFPTLVLALKIVLTTAVSVASCERSFSKLKLIESDLRTKMGQGRLSNLAILSIERDRTHKLKPDRVVDEFFVHCRKRGRPRNL